MYGVFNSENDPKKMDYNALIQALNEPDYLIALLQTYAFRSYEYNLQGEWDGITPGSYKKFINGELQVLENQIWAALERFQINMRDFKSGK